MLWQALVKTLPFPMCVIFGQAMLKLWAVSPFHVILLSIMFTIFVVAAQVVLDQYDTLNREARYRR